MLLEVEYLPNVARERGIDSTGCDEYSGVDEAGEMAVGTSCYGDDEADQDSAHWDEDIECSADFRAIRVPCRDDSQAGGGDVYWDGEELCC